MFTAQVDLPTPPFPAPTERIFFTPGTCCFCGTPPVRETCASHVICALGEPGRVASAASMSSWILFLSGHAGVVSTTRMPIVAASTTATSWIILSSIIGRWSSGSCTADRALRTVSFESCVTAIRTSLPRAADVPQDDVVDQALHRRQVVREHGVERPAQGLDEAIVGRRPADVDREDPARVQVRLRALEELTGCQIER